MPDDVPSPFRIRALTVAEMALPVAWAAAEGWNPGRHDAEAFFAADPEGFLVGETLAGEPTGVISAVRTGADFGFIGFYVCAPAWRGRGCGPELAWAALARLKGRTIGIDGVLERQANYARLGFVFAHRNLRYGGVVKAAPGRRSADVVEAAKVPFAQLLAYDAEHYGREREGFLRAWLTMPESLALARFKEERVCGFAVARRCVEGVKIGPLFADSEADAEVLFSELAGWAGETRVFLDLPEPNGAAAELARRHGLEPVFETARMYAGAAPKLPLARIYGITSFELG